MCAPLFEVAEEVLQTVQQQLELALLQPPFYEEVIPLLASMQRDCQVGLVSCDCHMTCSEINHVCCSCVICYTVCMFVCLTLHILNICISCMKSEEVLAQSTNHIRIELGPC